MTQAERPTFSVIVVSRERPTWLKRCVTALKQLDYPAFEIVVVADGSTLVAFNDESCKLCEFDEANISAARNVGIHQSAGDICAFIDDDSVAEPLWLHHLATAFEITEADAAVGYVRGRNGIGFQSRAASVDAEGETHVETFPGDAPSVPSLLPGRAIKLIGTNMAIRRDVLIEMGGFDEAFRFFLDDTDLSLRLQEAGKRMAVAPLAEVHHGFAPSVRRSARRAPLDLFDIGRSTRHFIAKHGRKNDEEIRERIERRERARLISHMVSGTCEPGDVARRLSSLRSGWEEGGRIERASAAVLGSSAPAFRPVVSKQSDHVVISSLLWLKRQKLIERAALEAENGRKVSAFSFSLTPARHHVRYVEPGVWLQTGGLYGKSDRTDRWFNWCRFADRLRREIARVAKQRGIGDIDAR